MLKISSCAFKLQSLGVRSFATNASARPKTLILGSGWSSLYLVKNLDHSQFDVHVVSQRDHFVFTPLLPKVCSGMIRPNTCMEPIVNFLPNRANFYHGKCISVDSNKRHVTLEPFDDRRVPINVPFDILILAVGAESNSFGIPGVYEHAFFLKEVEHACAFYRHLTSNILAANLVLASAGVGDAAGGASSVDEELKQLLHVIVVGGGPTGVEVAGEINWLFVKHLKHSFPHLVPYARVTIVEGGSRLLPSFGAKNSIYVARKFAALNINVRLETCVTEVHKDGVSVKDKSGHVERLHGNSVIWASGLKRTDFAAKFCEGLKATQSNPRGILVDANFKVLGAQGIYALGDCAKIVPPSLADNVDELVQTLGVAGDATSGASGTGGTSSGDFVDALVKKHKLLCSKYPQVHPCKVNLSSAEIVSKLKSLTRGTSPAFTQSAGGEAKGVQGAALEDFTGSGRSLDSLKKSGPPFTSSRESGVALDGSGASTVERVQGATLEDFTGSGGALKSGGVPTDSCALEKTSTTLGRTTSVNVTPKKVSNVLAALEWLDKNYLPPFPTAQFAKQQSLHLARHLNSRGKCSTAFLEVWKGSLASIGGKYVVGHFGWGQLNGSTLARAIWYAVYITMFTSWRMRVEFIVDAVTQAIFKRKLVSK